MSRYKKSDFVKPEENYIRVGVDYFKVLEKPDRFGITHRELKRWKKDEITLDYGKKFLENVAKYDDFIMIPNNLEYTTYDGQYYNLYSEFPHTPKPGKCEWSKFLIDHIFGSQAELGMRYMKALYLHPDRMLPILVLVSKERQTGKTTFINWLNMIFGANLVLINPDDLVNSFNASYAIANIIAVEETLIEKSLTVEKLKSLATGKFINVNQKYVSQYKMPFYGKIILASNNEDKFARIDEEEIRFFVRKVNKPAIKNHNIEKNLQTEIPAFLDYLIKLPEIDWSVDRSGFTPDELKNEFLLKVKRESRSALYKDLKELITDYFNNMVDLKSFRATPSEIKQRWFTNNSKIEIQYIRRVLKEEFRLEPEAMIRYIPFADGLISKTGTPFLFEPNSFGISEQAINDAVMEDQFVKNLSTPF